MIIYIYLFYGFYCLSFSKHYLTVVIYHSTFYSMFNILGRSQGKYLYYHMPRPFYEDTIPTPEWRVSVLQLQLNSKHKKTVATW